MFSTTRRIVDGSVQFIPPRLAVLVLDYECIGVRWDYFAAYGARLKVRA